MSCILSDDARDPAIVGGKAAALTRLRDAARGAGADVPPYFVIPAGAIAIENGEPVLQEDVASLLPSLGAGPYAVRSSAIDEDGAASSFAGQFHSFLDVAADDVPARVLDVWRSGFTGSVSAYRDARDAGALRPPAILVQAMVQPDAAGVAFAADPVSGARDVRIIDAVPGLADALVGGTRDGDSWRYLNGHLQQPASERAWLNDADRTRILTLIDTLSTAAGAPQDVEWAIAGDRLFLLQSRPITALPPDPAAPLVLWDNSNIVESYSGVTTPLTFSFAHHAYGEVYLQLTRLLAVPRRRQQRRRDALRDMIGLVQGRIYYNLLNWYRALALLPGYDVLRPFMEQMMGVDRSLSAELLTRVEAEEPPARGLHARVELAWGALRVAAALLARRVTLRADVDAFHRHVEQRLTPLQAQSIGALRLDELAAQYRGLERDLLANWSTPLVNDLFCMASHGLFRAALARWVGSAGASLSNAMFVDQHGIISAEPAARIRRMGEMLRDHPDAAARLRDGSVADAQGALVTVPGLTQAYDDYLAKFGDRCIGELKLESATLIDDPTPLLRAIGHAAATTNAVPQDVAAAASVRLESMLRGRKMRLRLLQALAREAGARIRDRENLRFERTRVFGRVRALFLAMGRHLVAGGALDRADDVLFLTRDELLGLVEGTAVQRTLRPLVAQRRREFAAYAAQPEPPRRLLTRGAVALSPLLPVADAPPEMVAGDTRTALGASVGTVRGRARVVLDPRNESVAAGEILVAPFTDPGWIALFARAGGIVVERGSLLSHSAIVAREMGIPAVVGLADATRWLCSGDEIEIDGAAGTVRRLPATA